METKFNAKNEDDDNLQPVVQKSGRLTMSEIEMIKEELQVKSQQLDEKEQETILLKAEIKRVEEKLTLTTNYLEEIINSLNHFRAEKGMLDDIIIVKDNQLHQLFIERVQLVQQIHEAARERNMLMVQLEEASRVHQKQSRKIDENMKDHREMSAALSYDLNEEQSKGFIFRAERDILLKRYKDLSANSQAVNEKLNNITHKHNQTLQYLQSSTQRNKILEESMVKMNVHYSKVCAERNELQMIAAMKFDDVKLSSPKEDGWCVTLNKSSKERDEQFINGALIKK